jgi:hypothetical protein
VFLTPDLTRGDSVRSFADFGAESGTCCSGQKIINPFRLEHRVRFPTIRESLNLNNIPRVARCTVKFDRLTSSATPILVHQSSDLFTISLRWLMQSVSTTTGCWYCSEHVIFCYLPYLFGMILKLADKELRAFLLLQCITFCSFYGTISPRYRSVNNIYILILLGDQLGKWKYVNASSSSFSSLRQDRNLDVHTSPT